MGELPCRDDAAPTGLVTSWLTGAAVGMRRLPPSTITQLYFAGRDPYGGASGLVVDTPQARRRPLTVAGPLPGLWGRFAELLHVRWLLDFGASEPVLAEQRRGIPGIYEVAAHPATGDLFGRLKGDSAGVEGALATSQALLRPLL